MREKHRYDEQFIMNCIKTYLENRLPFIQIVDGEDPPDYYALLNGHKIPLEITRAEIEFNDKGKRKSYLGVTSSLFKLLSGIDAHYNSSDYNFSLHVLILGPVNIQRHN